MERQELTVAEYLAHLRRHPLPAILSTECLAAMSNIEKQYGNMPAELTGLEVRLTEAVRHVDYILKIKDANIPAVEELWYELDYEEFAKGSSLEPCLFANTSHFFADGGKQEVLWEQMLPAFLGKRRAEKLRQPLEQVMAALPEGAYIKQMGTMNSRGELDIMRLVIWFPSWESVFPGVKALGWPGDREALQAALQPWQDMEGIAINLDLGEQGILPKIGVELFFSWRHPLLVDKLIARLEAVKLCLPEKGQALRQWIRIRPDGNPVIQPSIVYFKLNYKAGKITGAKAYLAQTPCLLHHYFDAYDRPVYAQIQLQDQTNTLPAGEALRWLEECADNRVRKVQFIGSRTYEPLGRLLAACRELGIEAEVLLTGEENRTWLEKNIRAGTAAFLIEADTVETCWPTVKILRELQFPDVRVRWRMAPEMADRLQEISHLFAEDVGVKELILTGMRPGADSVFSHRELAKIAAFLWEYEKQATAGRDGKEQMQITVDPCFSALRAVLGGRDSTKNGNRGIARGCGAGRDHFCVDAGGRLTPCAYLDLDGEEASLAEYWESAERLQDLRTRDAQHARPSCAGCAYERRCLPCPVVAGKCYLPV